MNTTLRTCTMDDLSLLQAISIETFNDTFKHQNTPENMAAYMNRAFNRDQLARELAQAHSTFYFVYAGEEAAGYLKLNREEAQSENMGPASLEIERIYVRTAFQGLGFGKTLIQLAIDIAKEEQKEKLWLGVWEKNERAIAFYQKWGFTQTGAHSFYMGDEKQRDYILVKLMEG
ncbi:GNAT family N-acetyltransferase [Paenibacillus apis]|uniref:Spermidine/spermine N(1)-acetyltransferase n=1 Tax=Paenibacillus apis TaxID=1792174 RepID=A0A919Y5V4_9BACL|nr:GNAT family N-acetyltransferase [Paenibacillus apis]GIO43808.1 spermidine/spermine N(1)-acetyltransferase [Paenibacillus apis]